jgi:hypothetical protein
MRYDFSGRFEVLDSGVRPGELVLKRQEGRDGPGVELLFAAVSRHDLPRELAGVALDDAASLDGVFELRSGSANYHVAARSIQVHETVRIYGRAIQLARFPISQRLLWMLLLWSVRYGWGQRLIARWRRA